MNKYLKEFLHRGLIFGGFGPIILGIIYMILSSSLSDFSLNGQQIFLGIVSVYLLAFIQAGASVFNQIESWPLTKSLFCHFTVLYFAYVLCYVVNTWIPFEAATLLIFTIVFAAIYLAVWIIVYLSVRAISKRLNKKLD